MTSEDPTVQPQQQVPYYQPYFQFVPQQMMQQPVFVVPAQQYDVAPLPSQEQSFYPQIPVQQPQYMFREQPEQVQQNLLLEAPRRYCKKLNVYKICAAISILSFVAYFVITPGAFPWFLVILALSSGTMSAKYIRENYESSQANYLKHISWFACINTTFLLVNLWVGGFPWRVVPISIWGGVIGFHSISMYNKEPLQKKFLRHLVVYIAVGLIVLVCCSYIPSSFIIVSPRPLREPGAGKFPHGPKHDGSSGQNARRFVFFSKHGFNLRQHRPQNPPQEPGHPHPNRPEQPSDRPQQPSTRPVQTTTTKPKETKPGDKQDKKKPRPPHKPEDEEYRKEYARERARHDINRSWILRFIGLGFILVWTVVLFVHFQRTRRAIKERNAQISQPQLSSVIIQPNTGSIQ